jgi:CBS domain-containing protein
VIDKGKLVGIVTERDMVQKVLAVGRNPKETPISSIMSKPVITVSPETSLSDAATVMVGNKIRRLPVVKGLNIVGILTVSDFAKYMHLQNKDEPIWAAASRAADYQTIFE